MFKLTILPQNDTIEVSSTDNLLNALKSHGYEMHSSCGGCASCGDCVVKITSGSQNLNDMTFEEKRLLGNVFHLTQERLSCQIKITGPVTIDISQHPGKMIKSSTTILKKRDAIVSQTEPQKTEDSQKPKRLGGNARPKPFKFDPDSNQD